MADGNWINNKNDKLIDEEINAKKYAKYKSKYLEACNNLNTFKQQYDIINNDIGSYEAIISNNLITNLFKGIIETVTDPYNFFDAIILQHNLSIKNETNKEKLDILGESKKIFEDKKKLLNKNKLDYKVEIDNCIRDILSNNKEILNIYNDMNMLSQEEIVGTISSIDDSNIKKILAGGFIKQNGGVLTAAEMDDLLQRIHQHNRDNKKDKIENIDHLVEMGDTSDEILLFIRSIENKLMTARNFAIWVCGRFIHNIKLLFYEDAREYAGVVETAVGENNINIRNKTVIWYIVLSIILPILIMLCLNFGINFIVGLSIEALCNYIGSFIGLIGFSTLKMHVFNRSVMLGSIAVTSTVTPIIRKITKVVYKPIARFILNNRPEMYGDNPTPINFRNVIKPAIMDNIFEDMHNPQTLAIKGILPVGKQIVNNPVVQQEVRRAVQQANNIFSFAGILILGGVRNGITGLVSIPDKTIQLVSGAFEIIQENIERNNL